MTDPGDEPAAPAPELIGVSAKEMDIELLLALFERFPELELPGLNRESIVELPFIAEGGRLDMTGIPGINGDVGPAALRLNPVEGLVLWLGLEADEGVVPGELFCKGLGEGTVPAGMAPWFAGAVEGVTTGPGLSIEAMEPSIGAAVAGMLLGDTEETVAVDRHEATRAASDSKAANAMSMRPRRTVTSPLVRKSLTMVPTVVLAIWSYDWTAC